MQHGYYGRLEGKAPKKGVVYYMFEEAMDQKLAECISELTKETQRIYKQYGAQVEKLLKETTSLNERFGSLLKIFEKDELKEKVKKAKQNENKK